MKILKFKYLKQFVFSFISILLCFAIVLSMSSVSVKAVAGIDDALFWLLVAILSASGITFVSASDARVQCQEFFDTLSQDTKNTLSEKANLVLGSSAVVSGMKVGVNFLAEQWRQLTTAIISKYGYKGNHAVNGYTAGRKLDINDMNDNFLVYNYYVVDKVTTSNVANLEITTFTGNDFTNVIKYLSQEELSQLNISNSKVYRNYSLAGGLFTAFDTMSTSVSQNITSKSYFAWSKDRGYIRDVSYASVPFLHAS